MTNKPRKGRPANRSFLTPERFAAIRAGLGVPLKALAYHLRRGYSTIWEYEHGRQPVPYEVAVLMLRAEEHGAEAFPELKPVQNS